MKIREATVADAEAMSSVLQDLLAARLREKAADTVLAVGHYIEHPDRLSCFVAHEHDRILGFQSLKLAHDGNPYGTQTGWGIIGTHVRPSAARTGVGSQLFAATLAAARAARLPAIEAYIGDRNRAALAYYDAMGFRTYRGSDGIICKALLLA